MRSPLRALSRSGAALLAFVAGAATAFAQVPTELIPSAPSGAVGAGGQNIDVKDIIGLLSTYLLSIAGALAVLFLILGGIMYTTAGGSEDKVQRAKKYMMNAVIGLVVVLLAFVIVGNTRKGTYRLNSNTQNPSATTLTATAAGAVSATGTATLVVTCAPSCPADLAAVSSPVGLTFDGKTSPNATTTTFVVHKGTAPAGAATITVSSPSQNVQAAATAVTVQ